jgi:hypothetical protein
MDIPGMEIQGMLKVIFTGVSSIRDQERRIPLHQYTIRIWEMPDEVSRSGPQT